MDDSNRTTNLPLRCESGEFDISGHKQYEGSQLTARNDQDDTNRSCPYGCCHAESTAEYIFKRAFLEGAYSDVTIDAFGNEYKLHRLFLDKSDYFKSRFKWAERQDEPQNLFKLDFDNDPRYTQTAFELAIARLYGAINIKEENKVPYNMIAVGQYLAITEAVCTATDYIVSHMTLDNISYSLRFATLNSYGSASGRIIENGKGMLSIDGWEHGPAKWDGIPVSVIAEVVGEDYFFVPTEWDRCVFIIKLLERRLEGADGSIVDRDDDIGSEIEEELTPLRDVLNTKVNYCHLSPEQLQGLEQLTDIDGNHYIDPSVLHNALWRAVQLQGLVLSAPRSVPQLENIISSPVPPDADHRWYKVPGKDDTITGLPAELDRLLYKNGSVAPTTWREDGKSTQGHTPNENEDEYHWTKIPPFRLSVSFANVSELVTDKRVYAQTFWYAGSYWNLYLQKNHIPSKNIYQVGVYLHRANNSSLGMPPKNGLINTDVYSNNINYQSLPRQYMKQDEETGVTAAPTATVDMEMADSELKDNVTDETLQSISEMSMADRHNEKLRKRTSSSSMSGSAPSFLNYEDNRTAIRVYFLIFTPSRRLKPTMTSFLSVPNDFSKSQSWGWKSNSMCVFNEDGTFPADQNPHLKFMIVLGNV